MNKYVLQHTELLELWDFKNIEFYFWFLTIKVNLEKILYTLKIHSTKNWTSFNSNNN